MILLFTVVTCYVVLAVWGGLARFAESSLEQQRRETNV